MLQKTTALLFLINLHNFYGMECPTPPPAIKKVSLSNPEPLKLSYDSGENQLQGILLQPECKKIIWSFSLNQNPKTKDLQSIVPLGGTIFNKNQALFAALAQRKHKDDTLLVLKGNNRNLKEIKLIPLGNATSKNLNLVLSGSAIFLQKTEIDKAPTYIAL